MQQTLEIERLWPKNFEIKKGDIVRILKKEYKIVKVLDDRLIIERRKT